MYAQIRGVIRLVVNTSVKQRRIIQTDLVILKQPNC